MIIRPYLAFNGDCNDAINLYCKAFDIKEKFVMKFSEMPPNPNFELPEEYKNQICQATLNFGDSYIRMSDSGPMKNNEIKPSERISLAIEANTEIIRTAFDVLSAEGSVKMPLNETFFSPCYGIVTDKFGITWNLSSQN